MSSLSDINAFFRGEWTNAVGSSNVEAARYEFVSLPKAEGEEEGEEKQPDPSGVRGYLSIRYKNGKVYQYFDVPFEVARQWATSGSLGSARWHLLGDYRWPQGPTYGYIS